MSRALPLRRRVALAAAAAGLALSLAFAAGVVAVAEDYEEIVATELLRGQAEDYALRSANGLPAALPRTQRLSGYRVPPPAYARLAPGVHEDPAHDGLHVGVFDTAAGRLWFVIDLGDIERMERHVALALVLVTVLGTALSAWLGGLFAGAALRPVRELAAAVDALPDTPGATHLAGTLADDELGHVAAAIDAYQARLVDADARQQAFFADASHALRTPVAVVQGAAEVLLDDDALDAPTRRRLARVDRGVQALGDLIELMLGVARGRTPPRADADLRALVDEALAAWPVDLPRPSVHGDGRACVAWRESVRLLRALLRALAAGAGVASIDVGDGALHLFTPPQGAASADAGGVSPLFARAAAQAGWTLVADAGLRLVADAG